MDWPYRFVDLSDGEKADRRHLLDAYATAAQASVLLPLLLIALHRLGGRVRREWTAGGGLSEAPGSPQRKAGGALAADGIASLRRRTRAWAWWCGDDCEVAGWRLGSNGEVVAAAGWVAWSGALCLAQTGQGQQLVGGVVRCGVAFGLLTAPPSAG